MRRKHTSELGKQIANEAGETTVRLRQVQPWKEVSDEAIVSRPQQAGDAREQPTPFMGVSSRGVQSESRKRRERNKEGSQVPFH